MRYALSLPIGGVCSDPRVLAELAGLRPRFPKLHLSDVIIEGYRHPPQSPDECIFARTTLSITADLQGKISPCQFGGNPDCSQCGCIASAGLKALGEFRLGPLPVKSIYFASDRIGKTVGRMLRPQTSATPGQGLKDPALTIEGR